MKVFKLVPLGLLGAVGCGLESHPVFDDPSSEADSYDAPAARPPPGCPAPTVAWVQALELHETTLTASDEIASLNESSVRIARALPGMVLASEAELFGPVIGDGARRYLGDSYASLDPGLSPASDGRWTRSLGNSSLEIQLFETGEDQPIAVNPFLLESYLEGATIETTLSPTADLEAALYPHEITIHYEREGPLARLLADGQPLSNPIVLNPTVVDLVGAGEWLDASNPGVMGPFDSLFDLRMSARLARDDAEGITRIEYLLNSSHDSLREITERGLLYQVESLRGQHGSYRLEGSAPGFVSAYLRGVDYAISGPGLELWVDSESVWRCDP